MKTVQAFLVWILVAIAVVIFMLIITPARAAPKPFPTFRPRPPVIHIPAPTRAPVKRFELPEQQLIKLTGEHHG